MKAAVFVSPLSLAAKICLYFVVSVNGQAAWDAALHLHDAGTAANLSAYCLDGSRGGFYYRPASNPASATKWKFHFQGGGWSGSVYASYLRGKSILGSSNIWTPWLSQLWPPEHAGFYGLMSANDTSVNPFGDFNFVWLAYCDGSSQTSDVAEPVVYNGTLVHFRGRALLDAHLFELERLYGFLSSATEVIISGTSAGGLSTNLHSSFIKSQLRAPGARLVAMPDAGFWWDTTAYSKTTVHPWLNLMNGAIVESVWNSTLRGALATCLADLAPQNLAARCYTQPYMHAYQVDVPFFVLQSLYDTYNLAYCADLNCDLLNTTSCSPAQVAAIQTFHTELLGNITSAQAPFAERDSYFLTACFQHEESCRAYDWYGITINGQTPNSTFYNWYTTGVGSDAARIDEPFPSDNTCSYNVSHGAC